MVKDAIYFLFPLGGATALCIWIGWFEASGVLIALSAFVGFFFRDPNREIPSGEGIIVSPADGRVVRIEDIGAQKRISIFLSIFNVHVNRSPITGRVTDVRYRRGQFRAAFNDLASVENERNTLVIESGALRIECSQIAGVLARRIVCWKGPGDTLERGERIGLIRFGSRTDLLIPREAHILVRVGEKVRGGSSKVAEL
jgi:phosphatidylserine decarboxylase